MFCKETGAKSSSEIRVPVNGKCQTVQEDALSKLGENANQETWHPSWYVPGIKVKNDACEIPKETQRADLVSTIMSLTGSRRQVVREE